MTRRLSKKFDILSQMDFVEAKRRAKLICDALDSENDEKVEEISTESIREVSDEMLLVIGDLVQRHGFYEVGSAIQDGNLLFFGEDELD